MHKSATDDGRRIFLRGSAVGTASLSLLACWLAGWLAGWLAVRQRSECDPARMSGAWVCKGTRVPIAALFENLEDDASVHQFLDWFPGVSLEQACPVLECAARSSLAVA